MMNNAVFIVVENGDPYPIAYSSFASAAAAVKETHAKDMEEQTMEAYGIVVSPKTDIPENTQTGKTYIYIEKEIHIYIYKLPILSFES